MDSTNRLEAFSDAVFAIIITLLVLDLRVPKAEVVGIGGLAPALSAMWSNALALVVSFCLIGVVWVNHHTMFRYIARCDHGLVVLNTLLLLCVAVLPFTTALLAEYVHTPGPDRRTAALSYSAALVVAGIFYNLLWWYAIRANLTSSPAAAFKLYALGRVWRFGPVSYALAMAAAVVNVPLSLSFYVALILYFGISGHWVARKMAAMRHHPAVM